MSAAAETRKKSRAANRILDALERGSTPDVADLRAAGVCETCCGFGRYYGDDMPHVDDDGITCEACGGTGSAPTV